MLLEQKTAIITGGSRGIGKAIAMKMAENGANIAIVYIGDAAEADETKAEIQALGVKCELYVCDVSDFDLTKDVIKQISDDFGGFDILVNNAGITRDNLLLRMSESDFDSVISINLKGAFNMIKHTFTYFAKKKAGSVINIASISGMMGNIGQMNYSAAKAGMIGMTKTAAKELAMRNVRCNAIAPGFIKTAMTDLLSEKVREEVVNSIPLKKMGSVDDIANLAVFLASDQSAYITGETIKIDGGLYI